jgi:hypothetical protein
MVSRAARRRAVLEACPAFGEAGGRVLLDQLVRTAWAGHAWHFDHIVAVKDGGRGLHSSAFQLNLFSAFCGIEGAFGGCLQGDFGVSGGIRGRLGVIICVRTGSS